MRANAQMGEYKVGRPERINEEELDYGLLDDLFWHHGLQGSSSMVVGGIEVQKEVIPYRSNSGRNTDFAVTFRWIGLDGTPRSVEKRSMYEGNRRNDVERSWGLPE